MSENPGNSSSPDYRTANADAKAAKAYAKASRPWYKKKRYGLLAVVLIVAIASATGSGGESGDGDSVAASDSNESSPKGESSKSTSKSDSEKSTPKPLKVEAKTLLKEFEENEAAADGKYKGKTLQVTGVLDKVDTEIFDDSQYVARVGAGTAYDFITVNCNDQSADDVSSLKKGQDITVIGKFDDGGDLGVELKNCTIK